jgi:hypothetical protein
MYTLLLWPLSRHQCIHFLAMLAIATDLDVPLAQNLFDYYGVYG